MSKYVEDLENELYDLLNLGEPLSCSEVQRVSDLSYELGKISVYNTNGWEYESE